MSDYEKFVSRFSLGDAGAFQLRRRHRRASRADPSRVALLWEDQDGNRARLTFADIREQSNRIANVLIGLGIKRGDPVMLVLPRITLWQAAYIGALKAGAIVVPCIAMLREKDLVYRANHSRRACDHRRGRERRADRRSAQAMPGAQALSASRAAARSGWTAYAGVDAAGAPPTFRPLYDARRRSGDLLLHLRHDQGAQGRAA